MIKCVDKQIIELPDLHSFAVIGDPGCDGLGAEIMTIFAKALSAAGSDSISIIAGDIVPFGSKTLYKNIFEFINYVSTNPVYTLCGNHDTIFYNDFFGLKDYAVVSTNLLIVILDNSKRIFTESTLALLQKALTSHARKNIVIMMHIPPPNSITGNSVNTEEWNKILRIINPFKDRIKYIITGHLHSYFEDDVSGIRLLTTGGGGARIEDVNADIPKPYHHIVRFYFKDEILTHEKSDLDNISVKQSDDTVVQMMENSFRNESMAHIKYRLFADNAEQRGLHNTAKLFRAASDAEFYHARNFFYLLSGIRSPAEHVEESRNNENYEITTMYREYIEYAEKNRLGLPLYGFTDAFEAEKIHFELFEKALESLKTGKDIQSDTFYTCTSCGHTFHGETHPKNCPVCGAPADKIKMA